MDMHQEMMERLRVSEEEKAKHADALDVSDGSDTSSLRSKQQAFLKQTSPPSSSH